MNQIWRVATVLCCLALCSCTYMRNANNRESCDKSIKDYNRMLRWQEVESAGIRYLDRSLRDPFMKTSESIRRRGVTITDFRILAAECLPEKNTADVVVEFDYYTLPSNRVKTLTYRQSWVFIETEEMNGWQIKSALPEFD